MKNTIKITIFALVLTLTANVAFGQQPLWAYKRDEGVKQLAAKNYTEAVKSYTECIEDNEKADQCYSGRGKAFDALGKPTEAADDFSAALKINPQNQQATEGLANKKGNSQKPKEKAKDDDEYADVLKEIDDQFDSMNKSDDKKTEKQNPKSSDNKTDKPNSSTAGVFVPTASPTVTNPTITSPNSAVNETAALLRDTLNGKFDIMEGKPLTYVLKMKKSGETFRYQIEFINDGKKLAFKWKEMAKNEESEKLVITDTALGSAISYVNFFTRRTGVLPIAVITFVLSRFQYDDLKRNEKISLKLGNDMETLIFQKKIFLPMKNYASNAKLLDLQTANGQTKMQILDNRVCPLIVSIETAEYTLELQ